MLWELFFMLVVLKIPVVYLCLVVWWAIRAEPSPLDGAALPVTVAPRPPECGWRRARLERGRGPVRPRPGVGASRIRAAVARARVPA